MKKKILLLLTLGLVCGYTQDLPWDSLDIQYRLLQTNYRLDENIIKIKVPPYLSTRQVMRQIKLAVHWPGEPAPKKPTKVYVFRDDAREGETSQTGGVYLPGKGYRWDLDEWNPDRSIVNYSPDNIDKIIYNTLLDSVFAKGMYSLDFESAQNPVKKHVAKDFGISVAELDSIYYRVKWWVGFHKQLARNQR